LIPPMPCCIRPRILRSTSRVRAARERLKIRL